MGLSDEEIKNLKDMQEFDLLDHVNNRFDRAGSLLDIPKDRLEFYRTCD